MAQARAASPRMRGKSKSNGTLGGVVKGTLVAVVCTLGGIIVFALLMQWVTPSDGVIRAINQIIKLGSVFVGVTRAVARGGSAGMARGAAVGMLYMGVGVAAYALLSSQPVGVGAYAADIAMGIAAGGLAGMLRANQKSR